MPGTRNPYPAEFRDQLVALARSGRSVESLAREFEPCVATSHGWVKQAERDEGIRNDGLTGAERDELYRLRRDNTQLRQERDIPSKGEPLKGAIGSSPMANAWFAHNDVTSSRSSSS